MQAPELAVVEAERCVRELGLRGFQIGSHVNQWNLSEPALFPVYAVCERLNVPLFVHPWDMMGQDKMTKYWLPWLVGMPAETSLAICSMIFGGVFARFPKLRVAFAHGGGIVSVHRPIVCNMVLKLDLIFARSTTQRHPLHITDISGSIVSCMGQTLCGFCAISSVLKRICLGTDYPFPLGELTPGELIASSGFSMADQEWMNHKSALEWLGMTAADFR